MAVMLRDRPAMSYRMEPGCAPWAWAQERFSGIKLGMLVMWDARLPERGFLAEHSGPTADRRAAVRVADAAYPGIPDVSSELLWSGLVYELYNLENTASYDTLHAQDRDDWIDQNMRLEFAAARKTARFFQVVWRPWAEKVGASAVPSLWFVHQVDSFEEWHALYSDTGWVNAYDRHTGRPAP